jgi:hypothetical protein
MLLIVGFSVRKRNKIEVASQDLVVFYWTRNHWSPTPVVREGFMVPVFNHEEVVSTKRVTQELVD